MRIIDIKTESNYGQKYHIMQILYYNIVLDLYCAKIAFRIYITVTVRWHNVYGYIFLLK